MTLSRSDRPLRILQLGLHWFTQRAGGLDRYVAGLTTYTPSHCQTRLLALRANDNDAGVPEFVRFYARASDGAWSRRRRLAEAFADECQRKPDVIASHFAQVAHPVRGRPMPDVPHIVHFHGPWAAESAREGAGRGAVFVKQWIERSVYRRADRLICLSDAFAALLIETYGVDPGRVVVIPGGVDVERFDSPLDRRSARAALGWSTDRPTIVCVRRLVRRMGLEALIDAADIARQRLPDLSIKICGKGPIAAGLAERVRSRGLDGHVELVGFVPDETLPLVYRAADLSIVPSQALEGFGLTTIESLAAGTPCLVTPVGGLPEVVRDLAPSLILSDGSPPTIAEAFHHVLASNRVPLAESCRTYARERFAWPAIAARVHVAYQGV